MIQHTIVAITGYLIFALTAFWPQKKVRHRAEKHTS